ncbi:hypothetical protein QUC31_000573 [Theobroma cacao]|nr:PREDICTED: ubiquitin-conjugating enzyme E2 11 [Theobroma cacao]WRX31394.1 Ubiquitin-conjugating enzyme E2 - like 10 [Theobroma cacao]
MSARTKRIQKEWANVQKDKEINNMCSVGLVGNNLDEWQATIFGQPGTPYEGGLFNLSIVLPSNYPFAPPKVTFKTKIYHPNINEQGSICLDILKFKDKWTPAYEVRAVIIAICSLMNDPNPDDPLVPKIGAEYKNNRSSFEATARQWTMQFALP